MLQSYTNFLNALAYKFLLIPFGTSSFYPIIKERWKNTIKINDESQASSLAGYEVKFPLKILSGYNLQYGIVETAPDNTKFMLLFYSKEPLTDSIRLNEFFKQKGIWIIYRKWISSQEGSFDFHIPNFIGFLKKEGRDGYEITITRHKGIASSERDRLFHGVDIHDPSQVEFMMDETHITLQGYLPKEDLIKIAESIR